MSDNAYDIAIKAKDIAEKIGEPIIDETYYLDYKIGKKYIFEGFKIEYYNYSDMYAPKEKSLINKVNIYLNNTLLFEYDFHTNKKYFKDGSWPSAVDAIYKMIPNVLENRRIENNLLGDKIEELKSLEDSFIYYINCFRNNEKQLDYIKSELEKYGISCIPDKRRSVITISSSDYDHYHDYIVHLVYYGNEEVAEFMDNPFNVFPNLSYYVKAFKSGYWTDIFKSVIKQSQYLNDQLIDDSIDAIIKKLNID